MKIRTFIAFTLGFVVSICNGQAMAQKLKISEFHFQSIFAVHGTDTSNVYSIIGTGFFRSHRAPVTDSLMSAWLKIHSSALVIPVAAIWPTDADAPDSRITYCWIVDGKDTLNNFLVKNGCLPATSMARPKKPSEMNEAEKQSFQAIKVENLHVDIYINQKAYDNFISEIDIAEKFAQVKGLGIWKD